MNPLNRWLRASRVHAVYIYLSQHAAHLYSMDNEGKLLFYEIFPQDSGAFPVAAVGAFLQRAIKQGLLPPRTYLIQLVVFLDDHFLDVELLQMPMMTQRQLDGALKLKLGQGTPFVYDIVKGPKQTKAGQLVVLYQPEHYALVHPLLTELVGKGFAVAGLYPAICGLASHFFSGASHELSILIHIQKKHTSMLFVQGQAPLMQRIIHPGVDDLVDLIAQPMITDQGLIELTRAEAEEILEKFGVPEGAKDEVTEKGVSVHQIFLMFQASLDRIILETRRSVDFFQRQYNEENVDRIVLTGPGARIKNISQYFKDKLDDRLEHVIGGPEVPYLDTHNVLTHTHMQRNFNLLPRAYSYRYALLTAGLMLQLAVYVLIVISLLFTAPLFGVHLHYVREETRRKGDMAKLAPLADRLSREQDALVSRKTQLAKLQTQLSQAGPGSWQWLEPATRLAISNMYFENLNGDLQQKKLLLQGWVVDGSNVSKEVALSTYLHELQNVPTYRNVTLKTSKLVQYRGRQAMQFDIEVAL